MSITFMVTDDSPKELFIHPHPTVPTIPGHPAYVDGQNVGIVVALDWHAGSEQVPAFVINGEALKADTDTLCASTGGVVNFSLNATGTNSGRTYLLLGGITGTDPGTPLPGGLATLPLNWDLFTNMVISLMNSPVFTGFMGTLDGNGESTALFDSMGPLPAAAVGLDMSFAFALLHPWDFVSNPLTVTVAP
jgi:hypothetical protein